MTETSTEASGLSDDFSKVAEGISNRVRVELTVRSVVKGSHKVDRVFSVVYISTYR